MITNVSTIEELVQVISEQFFNKTSKVTKISDDSVINGTFFGIAKVGQKAMTEIALIETQILPESATGNQLDLIAQRLGIPARFGALPSSTYVLFVGNPGTIYDKNSITIQSNSGIAFELRENVSIGDSGYAYGLVQSTESGSKTNISSLNINKITPIPSGHNYIVNEYEATGGRDIESDEQLLKRIQDGPNLLAKNTLENLTQILIHLGSTNVMRVLYQGCDSDGKNVISVLSQNGSLFSDSDLANFANILAPYLSLVDSRTYENGEISLRVINAQYHPIDISFRCELDNSANPDDVRKEIQRKSTKILNLLNWDSTKVVEWEDFLLVARTTRGIKAIPDQYFFPRNDIKIPQNTFPRIRGFRLLDLNGNIISDFSGNLSPIYFPKEADYNFHKALLSVS